MIQLKRLLESSKKQMPNVLYITDEITDIHNSPIHKLDTIKLTVKHYEGDISRTQEILGIVSLMMYDLCIIRTSGLHNNDSEEILEVFETWQQLCNRSNIKLVLLTIPYPKFLEKTHKLYKKTGFNYIIRVNNWIKSQDNIIDLTDLNDDIYFNNHGSQLNREGKQLVAKRLKFKILQLFDPEEFELDANSKLQTKLIDAGYQISRDELKSRTIGKSTTNALDAFKIKNNIPKSITNHKIIIATIPSIVSVKDKNLAQLDIDTQLKVKGSIAVPKYIFNFLVGKGLTHAGACGILGNMQVESSFNTSALGDNKTSIGLVQWHNDRMTRLFSWSKENNLDAMSVDGQLEYLWWELNDKYTGLTKLLQAIQDPEEAARRFATDFERPTVISTKRLSYARAYYNKLSLKNQEEKEEETESTLTAVLKGIAVGAGVVIGNTIIGTGNNNADVASAWSRAASLKGFRYSMGNSVTKSMLDRGKGAIDCSGFVSYVLFGLGKRKLSPGLLEGATNLRNVFSLDINALKHGTLIGTDNGVHHWDKGRKTGIDHVVIVLADENGQLQMAECAGSMGVWIRPVAKGVDYWNKYAVKNNFGTTYIDGKITKTRQFWIGES